MWSYMCEITHACVRQDSFMCAAGLIHVCSTCATGLIHVCSMHVCSMHVCSKTCQTLNLHVCSITCQCVPQDSFMCAAWLANVMSHKATSCETWFIYVCCMTRSCVRHDVIMHAFGMTYSCVLYDLFTTWPSKLKTVPQCHSNRPSQS